MFNSIYSIFVFCFLLFLSSCMPLVSSYEQLRQDVLNLACDSFIRKELEQAIEAQSQFLTEEQKIKALQNMKKELKCSNYFLDREEL